MSLGRVGSTRSVPAMLGLPLLAVCALPPATLLRLQAALQGVGPELRALPRPKPLRLRFLGTPQRPRLRWACVLCLPHQSSSSNQELDEHSPGAEHLIPSPSLPQIPGAGPVRLVSSGELISGCDPPSRCQHVNHPESQEVFGQKREVCWQFGSGCRL